MKIIEGYVIYTEREGEIFCSTKKILVSWLGYDYTWIFKILAREQYDFLHRDVLKVEEYHNGRLTKTIWNVKK